jgi:hypothetical protein
LNGEVRKQKSYLTKSAVDVVVNDVKYDGAEKAQVELAEANLTIAAEANKFICVDITSAE